MADNSVKKGRHTKYSNKVGLFSNTKGSFIKNDTEVVLDFPFKDTVLEAGMSKEDVGREERFLHLEIDSKDIDTLEEPKVLTGFSRIDKNGEEKLDNNSDIEFFDKDGELKQNLLIKGNNLLALYTIREKLEGKVKLIYIDPPYNTKGDANTFAYNNTFNHSAWLAFMKNRLEVAKKLLRDDGFIAIAIDHIELFYLGVLADEIFNADNRIGLVTVVHKPEGRQHSKFFSASNEFMLVYAKDKNTAKFQNEVLSDKKLSEFTESDELGSFKWKNFVRGDTLRSQKPNGFYPIYVSSDLKDITLENKDGYTEVLPIDNKGTERAWIVLKTGFTDRLNSDEMAARRNANTGNIEVIYKIRAQQVYVTHWVDKKYNGTTNGTRLLENIIQSKEFSYPKSLYIVLDTLKIMTTNNDIILDFFAGSATTAHATMHLNKLDGKNRKFIAIEQMDYIETVSKKRLNKIINTDYHNESFIFFELKKYNQEFIDRIKSTNSKGELDEVYGDMAKNAFLKFWFDKKEFEKDENFRSLDLEKRKELLIDILDENQLYLNYAEMNDKKHNVSADEKALTDKFYGTTEN